MDTKEFMVDERHEMPFEQFGTLHLICLIFTIIVLVLIFIYRGRIRKINRKTILTILYIAASIMLLNQTIRYITLFYYGKFDFNDNLPIHLCYLSGFLFMFAILFKKHNLLKYTYFLSFIGPLPAIIWPGLVSTLDSFVFYNYTISHHFFLMSSFFAFFALKVKIKYTDVIILFIVTNVIFFATIGFNYVFETNYMFSSEIPGRVKETLPFLIHFHPVLVLEIMGLAIIHILFLISYKTNKEIR